MHSESGKKNQSENLYNCVIQKHDFLEKANLCRQQKDQLWPGEGARDKKKKQNTQDFQSSKTTLYEIILINKCHYTYFQTH